MGDLKAKSKELRQINQYLSHIFNNKLRQYDSLRIKSFLENILVIQKVFVFLQKIGRLCIYPFLQDIKNKKIKEHKKIHFNNIIRNRVCYLFG